MKNKKIMYGLIVVIALLVIVVEVLTVVLINGRKKGGKFEKKTEQNKNIEEAVQTVDESTEDDTEVDVNDFAEKINGYWTYKVEGQIAHEVLYSYDNYLITWVEDGGMDREGEIKKIVQREDECYELTVYYPETIYYDELMKEEEQIWIIKSVDKAKGELIFISGETETTYKFAGETEEEYIDFCKDERIPKLNIRAEELDRDPEALKIRLKEYGNIWSMIPPYFSNLDGVTSYNLSTSVYWGEKDGKMVYCSSFEDLEQYDKVKDWLPDDALNIEPAIYTADPGKGYTAPVTAYLWKIDNGYRFITILNLGGPFYNNPVLSVYYVTDLKYVSFIE